MNELKFKVGDKVRVVANTTRHRFEIGEVVTILNASPKDKNCEYKAENGEEFWWLTTTEVEAI